MSLAQVVLEIAQEMEESQYSKTLEGFVTQLRRAVKASEGSAQDNSPKPSIFMTEINAGNRRLLQESQENLQECMSTIKRVESSSTGVVELVGNPHSDIPEFMPTDENIPLGAMPIIQGAVYRMEQDGKLHYQEEPTRQLRTRHGLR